MERTISMRGSATVTAPSDITEVSLRISGKEEGFFEAIEAMSKATTEIKDLIESAGIERDSVKTSDLTVEPAYRKVKIGTDRNGYDKFKEVEDGFEYSQRVHFDFPTDDSKLSAVVSKISGSDVTPRIYFSFRNSDPEGMKNRALAQACKHAHDEAETIVTSVGAKLGRLLSVKRNFSTYEDDDRGIECSMPMKCCADNMSLDIDPDDYSVGQSVEMVWEITD